MLTMRPALALLGAAGLSAALFQPTARCQSAPPAAPIQVPKPGASAEDGPASVRIPNPPESEVARKSAELLEVVAELRAREVPGLTPQVLARRHEALDGLEAYARRGSFTLNTDFDWPMPAFIDRFGTRCAVAHLLDRSETSELLQRLAAEANHAHVAEMLGDPELDRWCREHGFTWTEIAYIQGPGMTLPPSQDITEVLPPALTGRTGLQALSDSNQIRQRRIQRATTQGGRWGDWWTANRHRFVDVRQRYHDAVPLTRQDFVRNDRTPRRPKVSDWTDAVRPALLAALGEDSDVATTAMVALARGASDDDRDALHRSAVGLLRTTRDDNKAFVLLALGILGDDASAQVLAQVVRDSREGRRALGRIDRSPQRLLAFAAAGLGECHQALARDALLEIVEVGGASDTDLRATALIALGRHLERTPTDLSIVQPLIAMLRQGKAPTAVLAQVPLALARGQDGAVIPLLQEPVAKFREPAELRRTCSAALGRIAAAEDAEVRTALMAQVRRDVDAGSRRAGVLALATMGTRFDPSHDKDLEAIQEIHDFLLPGLDGAYRQQDDLPWICLASGLLSRAHPRQCARLNEALRGVLKDGIRESRAAASLALGLARDDSARGTLRRLVERDADGYQVGYAAEALGLLNAKEARGVLLQQVQDASTEFVRYQAAVGLALLADPSVLAPMVEALRESNSTLVQAGLTRALGEIGDRTAIQALVELLKDRRSGRPLRTRAAGTLGMTLEPGFPSWIAPWKDSIERSVATPTLAELTLMF